VFYCHPWEFDPEQPRVDAPALKRWRHYQNMGKTMSRLERLVGDFSLGTVAEVLASNRLDTIKVTEFSAG
jgi:hypothetical protein